jgi:hypothetical protein
MKKLLTILAVAGFMAACNNGDDDTTNGDTTAVDTSMTTPVTPMPADTSNMGDTTKMGGDTSMKK